MFQLRGRPVAAAYTMRPEERQAGAPPHWNMYVTVSSADDSAKRAEALGGTIVAPPFDVMDVGRMAVLRDPSGAFFQIWEPRKHVGAMVVNEPGALCWTELASRDAKAAKAFYTALFGWKAKDSPADAPMEYTEFSVGEHPSIGMMPMPPHVPAQVPSYWLPYFQVADCDASFAKAKQLGAGVIVAPQDIPSTGRFAVLADRQGAMFAIFTFARG